MTFSLALHGRCRANGGWLLACLSLAVLVGASCSDDPEAATSTSAVVLVAPSTDGATDAASLERLIASTESYLTQLVGLAPAHVRAEAGEDFSALRQRVAALRPGLVFVVDADVVAASEIDADALEAAPRDSFLVQTVAHGAFKNVADESTGATWLLTAGDGLLGRQYAVYEGLRRLGARFYHPEEEFVPRLPLTQLRARAEAPTAVQTAGAIVRPDFSQRAFTFHSSHPLEHLEAFSDPDHPIDEAVNVNDWVIKNRGDWFRGAGRGAVSQAERAERATELNELRGLLGMRRGAGITLHNQQQGASASIDPSLDEPVSDQIERVVEAALANADDVEIFGIHFGPTEFTVTPDQQTVDWINLAGQHALSLRPELVVEINNHTSGGQSVENFTDLGCPPGTNDSGTSDYYDLAFHTDPRLGVKVHTVMFYPLEGPARVYNQRTFSHKLCLMEQASAAGRPLTWFPEGSWWLSFDNPIPVYLPLYIYTRSRDIELVKPLLASRGNGTLTGHRMFNSGHEWGYWQQDYAVGAWHFNADVPMAAVIAELTEPFCSPAVWPERCAAAIAVDDVLHDVMMSQASDFLTRPDWRGLEGGLFVYFAGEDPADEIAATTGFEFRPVRLAFRDLLAMSDDDAEQFQQTDLARLAELVDAYGGWLAQLDAVAADVPEAGEPWFAEVVDGLRINQLRAQQAVELYQAVVDLRAADASAALTTLAAAATTMASAREVITRREAMYRYPAAQTHGGGLTPDTAVANGTTYPYRVHTKTHLMTYWTNRHEQVELLIRSEQPDAFGLAPAFALEGVPLTVSWPSDASSATVALGDGTDVTLADSEHTYAQGGVYAVTGSVDGGAVTGGVVRAPVVVSLVDDGFDVEEPDNPLVGSILATVVPDLSLGVHADSSRVGFGFARGPGGPTYDTVIGVDATFDGASFETAAIDVALPVPDPSTGVVAVEVGLADAVFAGDISGDGLSTLSLTGGMSVSDLADALIALAGFDRVGALQTLGDIIGFDPTDPPEVVTVWANLATTPIR